MVWYGITNHIRQLLHLYRTIAHYIIQLYDLNVKAGGFDSPAH